MVFQSTTLPNCKQSNETFCVAQAAPTSSVGQLTTADAVTDITSNISAISSLA